MMVWTEQHDDMLCREIIGVDVFTGTRKGTAKRSAKWSEVVENLNNVQHILFKVDNMAVRDRYNLLAGNLRKKAKREEKESGTMCTRSGVERALEAIIEKEDAAEDIRQERAASLVASTSERKAAEDMRKKAMESLGETRRRKSDEGEVTPGKRKRSNGSDTIKYLKEKNEMVIELEKRKLELEERKLEEANKRHEEMMKTMQQEQQKQVETLKMMMMQQQQFMQAQQAQHNELTLKLFNALSKK